MIEGPLEHRISRSAASGGAAWFPLADTLKSLATATAQARKSSVHAVVWITLCRVLSFTNGEYTQKVKPFMPLPQNLQLEAFYLYEGCVTIGLKLAHIHIHA